MIDLTKETLTDICNKVRLDASYEMIETIKEELLNEGYTTVTVELFKDAFNSYYSN